MQHWAPRPNLVVLSGLTGSGKTDMLHQLREFGEQVIDLEMLARHRGSVFGGFGQEPQPGHEAFGDAVAVAWHITDPLRIIWIEDEGPFLGSVGLPVPLQQFIKNAPVIELIMSFDERRTRLCTEFGYIPMRHLKVAIKGMAKRLGLGGTHAALNALHSGRVESAVMLLMPFYDKAYSERARRTQREVIVRIDPKDGARNVLLAAHAWFESRNDSVASQL